MLGKLFEARIPTNNERDWINYSNELIKNSSKILDDEAKALVTLGSSLVAVYLAAITYIKIPNFFELPFNQRIIIVLIPICFFLISIGLNIYVYFPGMYRFSSKYPEVTRSELKNAVTKKYIRLKLGSIFFLIALFSSILGVSYICTLNPQFQPQEVQFVVPKEQWQTFQNMSIKMENNSQKTDKVILLNITEKTYEVSLNSGSRVEFKRDLVNGIIYNLKSH